MTTTARQPDGRLRSSETIPHHSVRVVRVGQQVVGRARDDLRRMLLADGHHITRDNKLRCPSPTHVDRNPSAHVFDGEEGGHVHCFGCGYHFDAFEYLVEQRGMGRRAALEFLDGPGRRPRLSVRRPFSRQPDVVRECSAVALANHAVAAHLRRAEQLIGIPEALAYRGFTVDDLRCLRVGAEGAAAVIPIMGPDGQVLRLKRRASPWEAGPRYRYVDAYGYGTPAWCSPGWGAADVTLVIEGELNAAICWCVRPDLDVVGAAGVSGSLPLRRLACRRVVLYADGDTAGRNALDRWARALHHRGCHVIVLDPWQDGDACDVAYQLGRDELRRRLQ